MKINRIIYTMLAGVFMMSCGDNLAELNVDPNASTSAGPGEMLTSAQGYYGIGLEIANEQSATLAQYWAGGPGVALIDAERFFYQSADFNNLWSFGYLQALSDLSYTIDNGNEAQSGAADILSVAIYQNLVDHYGNIPYFEALKGDPAKGGITNPKFDDAKVIYDDLLVRLDASIALLSDTDDELGDEDQIYNGDLSNWIAFANSLKLKLLMRQSITNSGVAAQVVSLINTGTFINSSANMAAIQFTGAVGQNFNPQYARREAGIGQFYTASKTTTDLLADLSDPRDAFLYDVAANTGTIVGLKQGNIQDEGSTGKGDYSFASSVAYAVDNDVILMSHWEVFFLRAEADMRFNTADDETAMYNAAVQAHFSYIGAGSAAAYLAADVAYDATLTTDVKSNQIGVQKWISMNGLQESEGWIESRRFDTPSGNNVFTNATSGIFTTPTRTVLGAGVFPSIYLYPQTEIDYNPSNVPSGRKITDKVFWDN